MQTHSTIKVSLARCPHVIQFPLKVTSTKWQITHSLHSCQAVCPAQWLLHLRFRSSRQDSSSTLEAKRDSFPPVKTDWKVLLRLDAYIIFKPRKKLRALVLSAIFTAKRVKWGGREKIGESFFYRPLTLRAGVTQKPEMKNYECTRRGGGGGKSWITIRQILNIGVETINYWISIKHVGDKNFYMEVFRSRWMVCSFSLVVYTEQALNIDRWTFLHQAEGKNSEIRCAKA